MVALPSLVLVRTIETIAVYIHVYHVGNLPNTFYLLLLQQEMKL